MKQLSNKTLNSIIVVILIILSILGLTNYRDFFESNELLEIQYIDVGNADANLIKLPDSRVIMIDAGYNSTAASLVNNLKSQGISRIDYLIATHPHADHIGGIDSLINNFEIGEFYMPEVDDSQLSTSKSYGYVLKAVENNALTINKGKAGMVLIDEANIKLEFIAPNSSYYESVNSYSIVAKLTYGEKSFLFMGDAETDSEKEILASGFDVSADVLKCGHHGSSTSSSYNFLKACCPTYAIISCSADNNYGHPSKKTLNSLGKIGAQVYITAEVGTVTVRCDETNLYIQTSST